MPHSSSSEQPNPAVLRFRGLDLEAMTALQMRNINAVRKMMQLVLDSTEEITKRQAEFFKSGVDRINAAPSGGDGALGPSAIFERQTEVYRNFFGALTTHVGELAEITSNCCADLAQEAASNMANVPAQASPAKPSAKAKSAAAKSDDVKV